MTFQIEWDNLANNPLPVIRVHLLKNMEGIKNNQFVYDKFSIFIDLVVKIWNDDQIIPLVKITILYCMLG